MIVGGSVSSSCFAAGGVLEFELLDESVEKVVSLLAVDVEERDFGFVVADHTLHVVVSEIVAHDLRELRVGTVNGNLHRQSLFIELLNIVS